MPSTTYNITLQVDPERIVQNYCDGQGKPISECNLSIEEILEQELESLLEPNSVSVNP